MKQMYLGPFTVSFLHIKINAWLRGVLIWHQGLCKVSCLVFLQLAELQLSCIALVLTL